MIPFLTDIATRSGCEDTDRLTDVLDGAARTQTSAIDAIFDAACVDENAFTVALAEAMGHPFWDGDIRAEDTPEDRRLARILPAEVALKHLILPLRLEKTTDLEMIGSSPSAAPRSAADPQSAIADPPSKGTLHLAIHDPFDIAARRALTRHTTLPVTFHLATRATIAEGLQTLYGVGAETFEKILQNRTGPVSDHLKEETNVLDEQEEEAASVVKFVNEILRRGLGRRATDIHLEPFAGSLRIRYRIDGVLEEVPVPERIKAFQTSVISRIKIMARLDVAERRIPQDGRIHLELEGTTVDVRVATIPSVEGESVSLRLLAQQRFHLDTMGILPSVRDTISKLLTLPNGIVLVTGLTGSGKSTTLYSFLSSLNNTSRRIVSIEDPVENKIPGVVQIAVKPEIGLDFAAGLRSILRGDPNIVMVGEMRDLETTQIAVRAALTGHLVFSTLHTNDAVGGITRLVDMGVEPFLVASAVRAFLAQRLVRTLCKSCRAPVDINAADRATLGIPEGGTPHGAIGCNECRGTGYHGRMAIYEVCVLGQGLQNLITRGAHPSELYQEAIREGFAPMRQYGWAKVLTGETTIEEVLTATAAEAESPDLVQV